MRYKNFEPPDPNRTFDREVLRGFIHRQRKRQWRPTMMDGHEPVTVNCTLTSVLYELLRDHVHPGDMEQVVAQTYTHREHRLTNRWLAGYAQFLAQKIAPGCADVDHMNEIHELMDGKEWNSDTMTEVANILSISGRKVREPGEAE